MKKILIMAAVGLFVILIAACAGGNQRIEVSCDDFYREASQSGTVEAKVGETFELALCSNPTTGFQWEDPATISDPVVLEQVSMVFEEPSDSVDSQLVGAPGIQGWTFKAMHAGNAQVSLTYSQPWEGGEKDAWFYILDVTVR